MLTSRLASLLVRFGFFLETKFSIFIRAVYGLAQWIEDLSNESKF